MLNWILISTTMSVLHISCLCQCNSSELNSTEDNLYFLLGSSFASQTIDNHSSFSMIVPDDSELNSSSEMRRQRRHVSCGKKSSKRPNVETFEQRSICPFRHYRNIDYHRIPILLEEVRCICSRPSHLSTYTQIRCHPLQYKVPVLRRRGNHGIYEQSVEELTLACIPVKPRNDEDDDDSSSQFMIPIQRS